MSSEKALQDEIARLTGAISKHRARGTSHFIGRSNTYVNPNYKPPSTGPSRTHRASHQASYASSYTHPPKSSAEREVVIDGVAFKSSNSSLVRKDLAKAPTSKPSPTVPQHAEYAKRSYGARSHPRPYIPQRKPQNKNMTLENGRRPMQLGRKTRSVKTINRQCPRFSTSGVCTKGQTCLYKHDPTKIAICWPFLNGKCTSSVETCSLSHDPKPERTPLCVHFANNGRCKNGESCLFPHVRVGPRDGICRDFAVLGYCEKGIDCDQAHVRECPDYAEKGVCSNRRCRLPHVIRANQRRAAASAQTAATPPPATEASDKSTSEIVYGDDGNIGDEFISLTFHESESDEEDDEEEGEGEEQDFEDASEDESENENEDEMEVHA